MQNFYYQDPSYSSKAQHQKIRPVALIWPADAPQRLYQHLCLLSNPCTSWLIMEQVLTLPQFWLYNISQERSRRRIPQLHSILSSVVNIDYQKTNPYMYPRNSYYLPVPHNKLNQMPFWGRQRLQMAAFHKDLQFSDCRLARRESGRFRSPKL